jgi:hypothetical protein
LKIKTIYPILDNTELFEVEKRNAISETFTSKIKDKLKDANYNIKEINILCNENLLKSHLEFFNEMKERFKSQNDNIIRFPKPILCYYPTWKMDDEIWEIFAYGPQENEFEEDTNGVGVNVTTFPENAIQLMMKKKEFKLNMEEKKDVKLIVGYCILGEFEKIIDGETRKGIRPEKNSNFVRIDKKNEPVEEKEDQHFDWIVLKERRQFYPCFEVILRLQN